MSGSGGGFSGGGPESTSDDCDNLVIDTQLSSPKQAVIEGLKRGDRLEVRARSTANTTVIEVLREGRLAGGLASPRLARLRECIAAGTEYLAEVTAIKDGQVKVRVRAR